MSDEQQREPDGDEPEGRLPKVSFQHVILLFLGFQLGGWLTFDGARALITGSYTWGPGPERIVLWADLVRAIGLDPYSIGIKLLHLFSGLVWLIAVLRDVLVKRERRPFLIALPFALWYAHFGTAVAIVSAILVFKDPDLSSSSDEA